MLDEAQKTRLNEKYMALFSRAKLRTTEVALILGVHRVTVSRYKSYGIGDCEEPTLRRLEVLIDVIHNAINAKDLPLEDRDITGKMNRISALKLILRKHKPRRTKPGMDNK